MNSLSEIRTLGTDAMGTVDQVHFPAVYKSTYGPNP